MNVLEYYLKISRITTHHTLIKLLTKRETMSGIAFSFHLYNIFDDYLMRIYHSVTQCIYILIHHFIKIIIVLLKKFLSRCKTFLSCAAESNSIHGCSPLGRWYM